MGNGNDKNRQKNYKFKIDQKWGIINQSKGRMTISIQSQLNIFGNRAVDQSVINWRRMRQNLPTPLIIFLNSFPFRLFFRFHSSQSPPSFIIFTHFLGQFQSGPFLRWSDFGGLFWPKLLPFFSLSLCVHFPTQNSFRQLRPNFYYF